MLKRWAIFKRASGTMNRLTLRHGQIAAWSILLPCHQSQDAPVTIFHSEPTLHTRAGSSKMTPFNPKKADMDRRNFLKRSVALVNGMIGAVLAVPALRFFLHPLSQK